MTPERIEEIKGYVKTLLNPEQHSMDAFHNAADIMDERKIEWIVELLAALEEAEKQLRRTQITSSVHEGNSDSYFAECERLRGLLEEAQQQIDEIKLKSHSKIYTQGVMIQTGLERIETLFNELAEAQQTIARQREALEWYGDPKNYEHTFEVIAGGNGIKSQKEKVLNGKGELARAALGNKEGVAQS